MDYRGPLCRERVSDIDRLVAVNDVCFPERAGFLNESNILREEDPLSMLLRALSAINETRPYKTTNYIINHTLFGD